MRTLPLRQEPSVRQIEALLTTIERELAKVGATVARPGKGGLTFRMPLPWRAPHLGLLLAITSGKTVVTAGHGGPWRVRYDLNFLNLRLLALVISLGLAVLHWNSARVLLLNELIALWGLGYGVLWLAATRRFQKVIEKGAREVVERRRSSRVSGVSAMLTGETPTDPKAIDPAAPPPGSRPSTPGT